MIKRLVVICCILLVPTIAAAEGTTNYGDFWVGGQLGVVFTPNTDVTITSPFFPGQQLRDSIRTDPGFSAGAIVGLQLLHAIPATLGKVFRRGSGLPMEPIQPPRSLRGTSSLLPSWAGYSTPSWEDERFTRGRVVPFLMFGPSVVWTNSDFSNWGGNTKTSTDFGIVAEVGVEFFVCPQLSIGPSFRYRHVWGPTYEDQGVKVDSALNQFMILGRVAWHF